MPATKTIISDCCVPRMTCANMSCPTVSCPKGWIPMLNGNSDRVGAPPLMTCGTSAKFHIHQPRQLQPERVDALRTEGDEDDDDQQDEADHRAAMPHEAPEHDPAEAEALDLVHLDRRLEVDRCTVDRAGRLAVGQVARVLAAGGAGVAGSWVELSERHAVTRIRGSSAE